MRQRTVSHLSETEAAVNALLERTIPALAESAGATEELKARDYALWERLQGAGGGGSPAGAYFSLTPSDE